MEMKQQKMRISDWNNRSIRFGKSFVFLTLFGIIIANMIASCAMDALEITGDWQFEGLEGIIVYELEVHEDHLYAGAERGLHFTPYAQISWQSMGVDKAVVRTFTVFSSQELLAQAHFGDADSSTIARITNGGKNWVAFRNGFGGGSRITHRAMEIHPEDSDIIFARGPLNVARSLNRGNSWESVYRPWNAFGGIASLLKIDPNNPEIIWAGGSNAVGSPYLARSKDGGYTWKNLNENLQIFEGDFFKSTAHSIAIHPQHSSHVLLGLGAGVFRSTDLGKSWESVLSRASVRAMANSPGISDRVYAGGHNAEGTLLLLVTFDFGETWQTVEMPDSPAGIRVNDLAVVEQDGREVIWFATNQGVFSYRVD